MATPTFFLSGHIVAIPAPAWGHLKPLAGLASKIVQERSDILVTLLTVGDYGMRVEKEIDRYFPEHSAESPRCNIRVINIGGEGTSHMTLFPLLNKGFEPTFTKLINMEPVLCSTGKSYDTPVRPSLAIADFFFPDVIVDIRKISENSSHVTVLVWNSGNAAAVLRMLGPEKYGGYGDVETKARELAATTGRDVNAIEDELLFPTTGTVLRFPGLPPIFDYEAIPQEVSNKEFQRILYKDSYRSMTRSDGIIVTTSFVYEPEAHETTRKWLSETNRSYYVLGPLQPPELQSGNITDSTKQRELDGSQNGRELQEFLDNMLQTKGPNSLIYIAWGTFFWPKEEHIWKLVDVLLELESPFILVHSSPLARIPLEVSTKIKASGVGMLSSWAPQQFILAHPVTGWFLSHCGQNSVTEAISQGIPLIAWPVAADQPVNAVRLSLVLDVAFELIEIRTEHVLKPLYRGVTPKGTIDAIESEFRQVLKDARGPVGDRKRRKAHALREAANRAWDDEGDAVTELRKLFRDNFP